jgi:hypothetical protein
VSGLRLEPVWKRTLPPGSLSVYNTDMAKSNPVKHRKRGPPPTGINPIMAFRPPPQLRAIIETYAKKNDISVSEAMRTLIEAGLKRRPKP